MGFRSTLITESFAAKEVPSWFTKKYPHLVSSNGVFPISSKFEAKFYGMLESEETFIDLQKIIVSVGLKKLIVVLLHECGGITRVKITHNTITADEPTEWKKVDEVEHYYCYGCSD